MKNKLNTKSILTSLLLITGIFFILVAIISAYSALSSYLERQSHGSGPFFANSEMFVMLTIIFALLGALTILTLRKIQRMGSEEKK